MTRPPIRVVKVGGSLLDLPDLSERIEAWLRSQPPARNILVVGGGPFVDALRRLDRGLDLGENACHWLAIDLIDISAHVLAHMMPDAVLLDDAAIDSMAKAMGD